MLAVEGYPLDRPVFTFFYRQGLERHPITQDLDDGQLECRQIYGFRAIIHCRFDYRSYLPIHLGLNQDANIAGNLLAFILFASSPQFTHTVRPECSVVISGISDISWPP